MKIDWTKFKIITQTVETTGNSGKTLEPCGIECYHTSNLGGINWKQPDAAVTTWNEVVTHVVTPEHLQSQAVSTVSSVTTQNKNICKKIDSIEKIRGRWDEEIRYVIEERAAILEFDAGLSREDAEAKAFAMMLQTDEKKKT